MLLLGAAVSLASQRQDADPLADTTAWLLRDLDAATDQLLAAVSKLVVARVLAVCGTAWRAEAEAMVDLAVAHRVADLPVLLAAAQEDILWFDRSPAVFAQLAQAAAHPQALALV